MELTTLRELHFLHPAWLLALPPLWMLIAWLSRRGRRDGGWAAVIDADLLPALRLPSGGRSHSPWWLIASIWTLAAVALAGVSWRRDESPAFRAPIDWILVLDLSPSMAATDVAPNRATRARYLISDLLNVAHDARVALVVFAGEPHTVAPLTSDVATIRALLPPLAPSIMPEGGDALAPALDEVGRLMHTVASHRPQVVVLTDGALDPAAALQAARRLRQAGATVNVVGVGTTSGAPEPDAKGDFLRDDQGRSVLSRLPVDQLERIATAGGGTYESVGDAGKLIAELKSVGAQPLNGAEVGRGQRLQTWRNEGVWLLPPLLLLASLVARRGWL